MNYTSFTALIITFHHMSAVMSLIMAIIFTAIIYAAVIRKRKNRLMLLILAFFVSLIIGTVLAEEMLQKQPFGIEIVQAG